VTKFSADYFEKKKKRTFREEATPALAGFHAGPLSWSNWNLEMLVFVERRKQEYPEKNTSKQGISTESSHLYNLLVTHTKPKLRTNTGIVDPRNKSLKEIDLVFYFNHFHI